MYLCEIMSDTKTEYSALHMKLVYALDILVLNACIITIAYASLRTLDWLWALVLCNFLATALLRQYLFHLLQIYWLSSPLNRVLKKLADITCALVFLVSVFPLILLAYIIYDVATKKRHNTPIFTLRKVLTGKGETISTVFFSQHILGKDSILDKTPWVFNILIGTFSLWDLNGLQEMEESSETAASETHEDATEPDNREEEEEEHIAPGSDPTTDNDIFTEIQK